MTFPLLVIIRVIPTPRHHPRKRMIQEPGAEAVVPPGTGGYWIARLRGR
jgi:hypothetical protein